mmetsp:Transcript_63200/g.205067  ORF Transcript_63200/g.205067 Transcript_63200/m.205067 type:complete len:194 (-) Transcript_63200:19-600(-)
MPPAAREYLVTAESEEEWRTWRGYRGNVQSLFAASGEPEPHDTVGCVALDAEGGLACGTSTGGVVGNRVGRVGDCPLVGSGGYADAGVGAVSATGHGEAIAKVTLSRLALWHLQAGATPTRAAELALETMLKKCGKDHLLQHAAHGLGHRGGPDGRRRLGVAAGAAALGHRARRQVSVGSRHLHTHAFSRACG